MAKFVRTQLITIIVMECDTCAFVEEFSDESTARLDGWHISDDEDMCADCLIQMQEQIEYLEWVAKHPEDE